MFIAADSQPELKMEEAPQSIVPDFVAIPESKLNIKKNIEVKELNLRGLSSSSDDKSQKPIVYRRKAFNSFKEDETPLKFGLQYNTRIAKQKGFG